MVAETEKELRQLKRHFQDLAERSYRQNIFTFTGFLSLAEQDVLSQVLAEIPGTKADFYGGDPNAERVMARFGSAEELGYEEEFPVTCLCIRPLLEKFSDNFPHRDFLGSIMNLGIDRSTVGDIFLDGKRAYVYCTQAIAPYICNSLEKVKHTNVKCEPIESVSQLPIREPKRLEETVSGERIDCVVAKVYNLSRSQSLELFRAKRIYLNGRQMENNSYVLKVQDKVTARGFGKFIYQGVKHTTKKGKLCVSVEVFV